MGTGKKVRFHVTAAPLESYSARSLYEMKFQDAAKVIARMDTMMKAYVSTQAQEYIDCLYAHANRFGNEDYEACDQPTIAQFRGIMGKIKHWETIMYWLLEVDVMMEAEELAKLAMEAENEIMDAMVGNRPGITTKQLKRAENVISKSKACVPRTQEIINQAAALTAMFYHDQWKEMTKDGH